MEENEPTITTKAVSKFAAISRAKIKDEGDIKLAANRRRRLLPHPMSSELPSATLLPRTANFTSLLPPLMFLLINITKFMSKLGIPERFLHLSI